MAEAILFVSPRGHTYDPDPVTREEGGTPEIVGSIRAGLVFALKEQVGAEEIRRVERDFARRALASWEPNPHIQILGNTSVDRLPIVSFGLRHPPRLLHSNFVVALLSDLFGIQARSGCFCAGPYIHRTYPIDDNWSARMDAECSLGPPRREARLRARRLQLLHQRSGVRVHPRGDPPAAEHAWKLLPLYHFDPASGLWRHRDACPPPTLANAPVARVTRESEHALTKRLEDARAIIRAVESSPPRVTDSDRSLSPQFERIRWFPLAREARARLARADARSTMSA